MFGHFTDLVANASGWAYAILFVLAFLDALIPIVPSETSVITAGVVASQGDLSLPLVVVFAAAGAIAGDNTAYFVGWRFGRRSSGAGVRASHEGRAHSGGSDDRSRLTAASPRRPSSQTASALAIRPG